MLHTSLGVKDAFLVNVMEEGTSVPREYAVPADIPELVGLDTDAIVDLLVEDAWRSGDEPIEITRNGQSLYRSSRWF